MAPNAALLIDFDNVTMGIRSDLSKELKNLLNSDIIKGKVAVQRAYADWRRYPQYIVSLAEASVDLIFAPAYGSAKKNATDIRLAIDALELVFTRPEIGTFILLSGDSDFSSLVLKLKEYGKYVIGVGIRESASDLLVQNCDEYYSYSVLSGLTKESDEERQRLDPWELVEKAVRQMAARRDVMRSDRLKQVMIELDSTFNEKELGFSKFSRFLSDAVSRDRLRLKKGENGQWEVSPPPADGGQASADDAPRSEARPAREETREAREIREPRETREAREPRESREPRGRRGGRGRDHERSNGERAAREERPVHEERTERAETVEPRRQPVPEAVVAEIVGEPRGDLRAAYELLRHAVDNLVGKNGESARDSDVKRRMLELHPGWDESTLGFSKFSRFLRQAHDAEVIDLRKADGGNYQVTLSSSRGRKLVDQVGHGRRSGREAAPAVATPPVTQPEATAAPATRVEEPKAAPAAKQEITPKAEVAPKVEVAPKAEIAPKREATPKAETPAKPEIPARSAASTAPAPRGLGARLGTRGRAAPMGPPPLLPGQAVKPAEATREEAPAQAPVAKAAPASKAAPAAKVEPGTKATPAASLTERLGLPTDAEGVQAYILGRYKGVGQKTIAALVEAFGATDLFGALEARPERVREVLGGSRRADLVLDAWKADKKQRDGAAAKAAPAVETFNSVEEKPAAEVAAKPAAKAEGPAAKAEAPAAKPAARRRGASRS
jgi:uncharacterized protein (TIGR00288 family)